MHAVKEQGGVNRSRDGSDWEALTHFSHMSATRHGRRSPQLALPTAPRCRNLAGAAAWLIILMAGVSAY